MEIVLHLPLKIFIRYFVAFFVLFVFLFFLEWHFGKRFVRLLHKLHENAKGKPFSTAPGAVYRSIDGTYVASQTTRLGHSRSLRFANIIYSTLALNHRLNHQLNKPESNVGIACVKEFQWVSYIFVLILSMLQ